MKTGEMTAGILAGGKSSRMGRNKARLVLPGDDQSFLTRIARELEEFSRLLVSVNDRSLYRDLPWELVEDELEGFGPVEGLYQLLRASDTAYTLVTATDMPFLRRELFAALAARLPETCVTENQEGEAVSVSPSCLILRREGRPEPLCSIYGRDCLPALAAMREEGEHRIRPLFERVKTWYADLEELGFSDSLIRNLNTVEELEAVKGSF